MPAQAGISRKYHYAVIPHNRRHANVRGPRQTNVGCWGGKAGISSHMSGSQASPFAESRRGSSLQSRLGLRPRGYEDVSNPTPPCHPRPCASLTIITLYTSKNKKKCLYRSEVYKSLHKPENIRTRIGSTSLVSCT